MPQLSKLTILGIAREASNGVYVAPTDYVPFTKCSYSDEIAELKDESYRGNDSGLQGMYAGVTEADWDLEFAAYPNISGYLLRGIIGPDTPVPGVATTASAATTAGATTISTVASIAANSTIQVDTGVNVEYATVTAVSGTGPYVLTVTGAGGAGLTLAHASGVGVVSATQHVFKQSIDPTKRATFSLTIFDTLTTRSYSGLAWSDLDIKIDPKNMVTFSGKAKSFQNVAATAMTPAYSTAPPALGWLWTMTNAGATSDRGLSLDLKIKRKIDVIHTSNGVQTPRNIFQGALDAEGTYKALYENQTDLNLFLQYIQQPVTATMVQPLSAGGSTMTLTMSKSGWHKGKRDWKDYVEADFTFGAIYNAADGGLIQASLTNFQNTAY